VGKEKGQQSVHEGHPATSNLCINHSYGSDAGTVFVIIQSRCSTFHVT